MPRARQGPGRDDCDLPHPRRLGGRGLQDPRQVRGRVRRPLRLDVGGGRHGGAEGAGMKHAANSKQQTAARFARPSEVRIDAARCSLLAARCSLGEALR